MIFLHFMDEKSPGLITEKCEGWRPSQKCHNERVFHYQLRVITRGLHKSRVDLAVVEGERSLAYFSAWSTPGYLAPELLRQELVSTPVFASRAVASAHARARA